MSLRIQVSAALVRRTTVLIALLVHHVPMAVLCERWSLSSSCLYDWQRALLLHGIESLPYRHSGGRRPKLTPRQASQEQTPENLR